MNIFKKMALEIITKIEFEESAQERRNCPTCKGKETVLRRITKEPQQEAKGRWYVETCDNEDCPYWDCGFT